MLLVETFNFLHYKNAMCEIAHFILKGQMVKLNKTQASDSFLSDEDGLHDQKSEFLDMIKYIGKRK
jgi:hypothetical protein